MGSSKGGATDTNIDKKSLFVKLLRRAVAELTERDGPLRLLQTLGPEIRKEYTQHFVRTDEQWEEEMDYWANDPEAINYPLGFPYNGRFVRDVRDDLNGFLNSL